MFFNLFCVPAWRYCPMCPGSYPLTDQWLFTDTRPSDECSPRGWSNASSCFHFFNTDSENNNKEQRSTPYITVNSRKF